MPSTRTMTAAQWLVDSLGAYLLQSNEDMK